MSRKKFSEQFKASSIEFALKNGNRSAREISQELGVGESTLSKWVAEHKKTHAEPLPQSSAEEREIRQLKRQIEELKEVNEILKKAHKYFVSQSR